MTGSGDETTDRRGLRRRAILGADSREASNRLLAVLREGRWGVTAWVDFLDLATRRSVRQAIERPRATLETTIIHLVVAALSSRRGLVWVGASWLMTVTHLGMLGTRTSLGLPNILTVIRGTLPSLDHRLGRLLPVLSLATDLADGKIARATGTVTPFGTQGDFLADTAFWTWFTVRHEPSRTARVATLLSWSLPVVGIATASMVKGRMLDLPRSAWFRPAAVMEIVIGSRAILRTLRAVIPPR